MPRPMASAEIAALEAAVVVDYPFVRCVASSFDGDGPSEFISWRPGVDYRFDGVDGFDAVANAIGKMHLTIVSTHKPGRYPERVFYTREWQAPNGRRFGKTKLHIATRQKFARLCRGYAVDFALDPDFEPDDVREFSKRRAALHAANGGRWTPPENT